MSFSSKGRERTGAETMALVDSAAAFASHCDAIDASGALKKLCVDNGLLTFSQLAFGVGTPQQPCSDDEFKAFGAALNGGVDLNVASLSRFRRLHFESQTLVVAHLKSQITNDPASDTPKKLPQAEKVARLEDQQRRLSGLEIKGELQPSFALIDLVASIAESGAVVWIAPSKCSKRDSEVQGSLKEKTQTLVIEQQTVKMATPEQKIRVDTTNELQLQWALQRRGLAFDQCQLVNYATHDKWVQNLLTSMTREAPPGYAKVSMEQVLRADKQMFTLIAQELTGSLKPDSTGALPMDAKMQTLACDPRVTMFLLPLPSSVRVGKEVVDEGEQVEKEKRQPRPKKKARPSPKAKSMCPQELKGYKQMNANNIPICWSFNLSSGCSESVSNGRCKKGSHECIKCNRANHGLSTCRVGKKN